MELTYSFRATDGQEYGPVNLDQISGWIGEGRVLAQNEVRRSDMEHWARAEDFTELKAAFPSVAAPVTPRPIGTAAGNIAPALKVSDTATLAQLSSGASWFYWIAGLSLINSISAVSGSDWRFLLGLGLTQILDAVGTEFAGAGKFVAFALDLLVAGVFILFGVFAHKRHLWAFIAGMVLFGLDSIIFVLAKDWLGIAFHAFALYRLFCGVQACRELNATKV